MFSAFDELGWMPKDVASQRSLEELEGIAEGKSILGKIGETDLRNKLTRLEIAEKERASQQEAAFQEAFQSAARAPEREVAGERRGVAQEAERAGRLVVDTEVADGRDRRPEVLGADVERRAAAPAGGGWSARGARRKGRA